MKERNFEMEFFVLWSENFSATVFTTFTYHQKKYTFSFANPHRLADKGSVVASARGKCGGQGLLRRLFISHSSWFSHAFASIFHSQQFLLEAQK